MRTSRRKDLFERYVERDGKEQDPAEYWFLEDDAPQRTASPALQRRAAQQTTLVAKKSEPVRRVIQKAPTESLQRVPEGVRFSWGTVRENPTAAQKGVVQPMLQPYAAVRDIYGVTSAAEIRAIQRVILRLNPRIRRFEEISDQMRVVIPDRTTAERAAAAARRTDPTRRPGDRLEFTITEADSPVRGTRVSIQIPEGVLRELRRSNAGAELVYEYPTHRVQFINMPIITMLNGVPGILFIDAEFTMSWVLAVSYGQPLTEVDLNERNLKAVGQLAFGQTVFKAAASAKGAIEAEVENQLVALAAETDLIGKSFSTSVEVKVDEYKTQTPMGPVRINNSNKGQLKVTFKAFAPAEAIGRTISFDPRFPMDIDYIEKTAAIGARGALLGGFVYALAWALERLGATSARAPAGGGGIFILVPEFILQPYLPDSDTGYEGPV